MADAAGKSRKRALAGQADKERKREANRRRTVAKAERERRETTGLSEDIVAVLSEEERQRLEALNAAFERESHAAYELKVQWSEQSQLAYASRDELRNFRLELERRVVADGRLAGGDSDGDEDQEAGGADADGDAQMKAAGSAFEFDGLLAGRTGTSDEAAAGTAGAAAAAAASPAAAAQPDDGSVVRSAVVVLVRTTGPVNLGQIARLCNNLAIADVRLVQPQCETNCSDSRKFAVHSKKLLVNMPVFDSLAEATHDCGLVVATSGRQNGANGWRSVYSPEQVPALLRERPAERFAVVFGNEANGLNDAELSHCHAYVRIPTRGYTSLNLGHAVAVTMYTLSRAHVPEEERLRLADPEGDKIREGLSATVAEVTRLSNYWRGTMRRFGWARHMDLTPANGYHFERRLVGKLIGQLRQINEHAFGTPAVDMMRTGEAPAGDDEAALQAALARVRAEAARKP